MAPGVFWMCPPIFGSEFAVPIFKPTRHIYSIISVCYIFGMAVAKEDRSKLKQ
jgi:hypothetical protein